MVLFQVPEHIVRKRAFLTLVRAMLPESISCHLHSDTSGWPQSYRLILRIPTLDCLGKHMNKSSHKNLLDQGLFLDGLTACWAIFEFVDCFFQALEVKNVPTRSTAKFRLERI